MTQSLRRSQFITTYGPGAILEGPDGPRVIPTLERSGLFTTRNPSDFQITDLRLSQALLDGAGILRLPSNAEVGQPDSAHIYETTRFPTWALCVQHHILYRKTAGDNRACPRCPALPNHWDAWRQASRQAIRFVRACPRGHMDDVDWIYIIQHSVPHCSPSYLLWQGGSSSLRHINIVCPNCHQSINLGVAYSRTFPCSGRFPEEGGNIHPGCDTPSEMTQRGAANLRMSALQTALTIPPRSTRLHRLLEMNAVRAVLITQSAAGIVPNKQQLLTALNRLLQAHMFPAAVVAEIDTYPEDAIQAAIADTIAGDLPVNVRNLRLEELEALRTAAAYGAPAQPSPTPGAPPQFEVLHSQVRMIPGAGGHCLRITPVNRLRVVMVQIGYRRLDPLNDIVNRPHNDGQMLWYPGVELFGEGIFIDFASAAPEQVANPQLIQGAAANPWFDAWFEPQRFEQNIHPDDQDQLHPVFVWWHTLSHRLMNALAVDSGYSSAAVRERVFVDIDSESGDATGGVLLYTAQPGGDGTLGGLVALVPQFERVLAVALRNLDACSNDPLCGQERFGRARYNGAACYACALVSETSCEHRNMRLDRNLLLENLP